MPSRTPLISPPAIPPGMDIRYIRPWCERVVFSLQSCVEAIRNLESIKRPITPPTEAASGLDLSTWRLGYSISGTTCTLKAGALIFYRKQKITIAQTSFSLGGTQYAYVHHVMGSSTAAWATAAVEPGVSNDLDVTCYKFVNGSIDTIYHVGDISFDLPLA